MQPATVIACKLADLQARCDERGYTLESALPCIVERSGDDIRVDTHHPAYPRRPQTVGSATKLKNFAKSTVKHVASGLPRSSDAEVERRFSICSACDQFTGKTCKACGCTITTDPVLIGKLQWAGERCPLKKW